MQNITKKVILLNGPPRCGKDTAAIMLTEILNKRMGSYVAENVKFSAPIKESLPRFFGLTSEQLVELENDKESPKSCLLGFSWRQVQIDLSEKYAKIIFGQDVFGKIAANKINYSPAKYFFVSDSGFVEEASKVVDLVGIENVLLIRIQRQGTDFSKDSRSYWQNTLGIEEITIENNGTILDYTGELLKVINDKFNIQ